MRQLCILHTEASLGWGGQEIRIFRESEGMRARGHRVIIAAPANSTINKRASEAGFDVCPFTFNKARVWEFFSLASLMKRERVDVINTHSSKDSWMGGLSARLLGGARPRVVRTRHLFTPISRSFVSRLVYMGLTDAVTTTGEAIREQMIRSNGFDGGKILSMPTGIDVSAYDPEAVRPSIARDGFMIGMVSVLRSWKGHDYLIQAAVEVLRQIPEASFYIAGDGPMRERLVEMVSDLGLDGKVIFLGHREDVASVMQSMDMIVHPSYGHEGVPQSVLQALALRKPVVASDVGAISEVVRHRVTGILIEPKNSELLAAKIVEVYNNMDMAHSLAEEGRRLVLSDYSISSMLDRTEAMYRRIISGAPVRTA